jgi:Ca2+/Na+ antiporter
MDKEKWNGLFLILGLSIVVITFAVYKIYADIGPSDTSDYYPAAYFLGFVIFFYGLFSIFSKLSFWNKIGVSIIIGLFLTFLMLAGMAMASL